MILGRMRLTQITLLLAFVGFSTPGAGSSSYLQCIPVSGSVEPGSSGPILKSSPIRSILGPPGKRGPPGKNGVVDYKIVNKTIESVKRDITNEQSSSLQQMNARLNAIVEELNELKRSVSASSEKECHIRYNGKCFTIILSPLTIDQARVKCKHLGTKLANIYSKVHYDEIMAKIKSMITYHTQFYLGMTYDRETNQALLRDGSVAPFVEWHMLFPKSTATGIPMGMAVDESNSNLDGMTNFTPPHHAGGTICEYAE